MSLLVALDEICVRPEVGNATRKRLAIVVAYWLPVCVVSSFSICTPFVYDASVSLQELLLLDLWQVTTGCITKGEITSLKFWNQYLTVHTLTA